MKTIAIAAARLIEPQTARVIDDLVAAFLDRDRLEQLMIDEHDQQVAAGERAVEVDQFGAGSGEFHRQAARIGLDDLDLLAEAARERGGDFDRRAFAEIVDIGLEREAEARDARVRMLRHEHFGGADDMRGLREIHFARGADQAAVVGRAMDEEPGVDRDAMAADAGAGLEDVDARVAVGEADHLPHIDAHMLGHHRQFVGKGDVDVAVAVLDQLHHFGGARRGGDAGAADELAIERSSRGARSAA
jgi:hypothetical protein